MANKRSYEARALIASFIAVAICETIFLLDVVHDKFDLDIEIDWIEDYGEAISAIALAFALIVIGMQIMRLHHQYGLSQDVVRSASGQFLDVIYRRFEQWELTPSESEIALFLIKGLSVQEIAELRNTRGGTVKSQSSTIYQKAGVRSRHELVAYFVEDLLAGEQFVPGE